MDTPTHTEDPLRLFWEAGLAHDSPPSTTESNAANRLLVAARDAFAANGYKGTTTRDIAAGAGMSPAAMYIHYSSKQEMLFRLSSLAHASCLASLRATVSSGVSARQNLRAAVFDFTLWHARNRLIGRTAQYEMHYLDEANRAAVADLRRQIHRTVEDLVYEGVRDGSFAVGDVPTTTLAILSLSIDTVRWFPSRTISEPEVLASAHAALSDRMVGALGHPRSSPL